NCGRESGGGIRRGGDDLTDEHRGIDVDTGAFDPRLDLLSRRQQRLGLGPRFELEGDHYLARIVDRAVNPVAHDPPKLTPSVALVETVDEVVEIADRVDHH